MSTVDLAWNWTRTSLNDFSQVRKVTEFLGTPLAEPVDVSLMTPRRQVELEEMNPEHRLVLTYRHQLGSWNAMLRPSYFSPWKACRFQDNDCDDLDAFDGGIIVDAEVGYTFNERYRLALGAQNIFDSVPDAAPEGRPRARAICARKARPGTTTVLSGTRACLWNFSVEISSWILSCPAANSSSREPGCDCSSTPAATLGSLRNDRFWRNACTFTLQDPCLDSTLVLK